MGIQTRKGIQSILRRAWVDCIENDYVNQVMNSERSLQASYWSAIKSILPANRYIFIEPTFKITKEGRKVTPDIIICSKTEVIAIIELKYLPKGKSKYQKDIYSLNTLAKYRRELQFNYKRFLGEDKTFGFSNSILFVWAGIYNRLDSHVGDDFSKGYASLSDCYMQLEAVTSKDEIPVIYQLTS